VESRLVFKDYSRHESSVGDNSEITGQ